MYLLQKFLQQTFLKNCVSKLGMATVTDFHNRLLRKPSQRVTGYSDNRKVWRAHSIIG